MHEIPTPVLMTGLTSIFGVIIALIAIIFRDMKKSIEILNQTVSKLLTFVETTKEKELRQDHEIDSIKRKLEDNDQKVRDFYDKYLPALKLIEKYHDKLLAIVQKTH